MDRALVVGRQIVVLNDQWIDSVPVKVLPPTLIVRDEYLLPSGNGVGIELGWWGFAFRSSRSGVIDLPPALGPRCEKEGDRLASFVLAGEPDVFCVRIEPRDDLIRIQPT